MTNKNNFIEFTLSQNILQFGNFITKAGRNSPYFFNLGLINSGSGLQKIGEFYKELIESSKIYYDLLYGPAYKGITLVSSIAIAMAHQHKSVPFAFNRKENKTHGEGGNIIGHPIKGDVIIIDDVISAGTSINESIEIIKFHGGNPVAVFVAIDRQEKGKTNLSAIEEVKENYQIPVFSLISLIDIIEYLKSKNDQREVLNKMLDYQDKYGVIKR
jgi:orotate phosphoribosyltransferase